MQQDYHTIEAGDDIRAVITDLDFLTAASLAADGDFDEAEAILARIRSGVRAIDATDLLARIAVQKGEWRKAEQHWTTVLESDPGRVSAQHALSRLRSPWLLHAVIRRLIFLGVLGLFGFLALIGIIALFNLNQRYDPAVINPSAYRQHHVSQITPTQSLPLPDNSVIEHCPDSEIAASSLTSLPTHACAVVSTSTIQCCRVESTLPPQTDDFVRSVDMADIPKHCAPPMFTIPGCLVTTNAAETCIYFENGIFDFRAQFTESGRRLLESVAREVAKHTNDFWIVVEGHTDSEPMPANSLYRDNYALGLHRAMAAVEVIKIATSVSGGTILGISAGDTAPPFPEHDYDSKLRNRTVVVRLIPKPDVSFRSNE